MSELVWIPNGLIDVHLVPKQACDAEAPMYRDEHGNEKPWFLVKTGAQLAQQAWPKNIVVVVCREAVPERAWDVSWERRAWWIYYAYRANVERFSAGLITGSARYGLLDACYLEQIGR